MTVRDTLLAALRAWADRHDGEIAPEVPEQMADAYRAEVLAEAKVETVAWLVKKATDQKKWDAATLASKIDRGAVRAFLGTSHYRDAMDAHRAQVLAEVGAVLQAELDAYRAEPRWRDGNGDSRGPGILRAQEIVSALTLGKDTLGGGQPPAGESTQPAPGFFQPGHTYTDPAEPGAWRFRCDTVTAHPSDGAWTALGWRFHKGEWEPCAYGADDWDINQFVGLTDENEAGEAL